MEKNISPRTKKEQIQGGRYISVYVGRYRSLDEAKQEYSQLKQLHHAFKNVQAIELGEK